MMSPLALNEFNDDLTLRFLSPRPRADTKSAGASRHSRAKSQARV
jgi:hypothetical protein